MGGEKLLVGLRGAKKFSNAFRIVFRILFRVFQTVFSYQFKSFSGAVSFCTRAALNQVDEHLDVECIYGYGTSFAPKSLPSTIAMMNCTST